MSDLKQRLDGIDRLPMPDLWQRAQHEPPREAAPSTLRRVAVIAAALVISAAAIGSLVLAFRSHGTTQPATPTPVANGDIWVQVGGGDGPTAIYGVDPDMSRLPNAMWTDSGSFGGARVAPELLADDYAFSPGGSEVVFSQQVHEGGADTKRELFVMNADGSGVTQLTHDGAYAGYPAWSPDGTTIAYDSYRGSDYIPGCLGLSICPTDLYLIDAAGGTPRPFATNVDVSETTPSWSPDGSRIAFAELGKDGTGSIVNAAVDGSDRIELTPDGDVSFPSWSPDGRWILYLLGHDGTNLLVTATPTDSGHHVITDTHTDTNFGRPVWSPDGELIAYARPYSGTTSLWTIDATGSSLPERVAGWPGYDASPLAWQPVPQVQSSPAETEVFFPTSRYGPSGDQALYRGSIIVRDGCLLIGGNGSYSLPIWPKGFTTETDPTGRTVVVNTDGAVVAAEGQEFEMGGGDTAEFTPADKVEPRQGQLDRLTRWLGYPIPERCLGPNVDAVWVVGEIHPLSP